MPASDGRRALAKTGRFTRAELDRMATSDVHSLQTGEEG